MARRTRASGSQLRSTSHVREMSGEEPTAPEAEEAAGTSEHPPLDFVRMYFAHQYERFSQLEQYGFTVSNFAIGVSLLAFGLIVKETEFVDLSDRQALAILVVVVNSIAGIYLMRVYRAKRSHQMRAKEVLRRWAHALWEIDQRFPQPDPTFYFKRSFIQGTIHVALLLAAVGSLLLR